MVMKEMKERPRYICENCGYESPKWFGRCPVCGSWNTAKEWKADSISRREPGSVTFVSLADEEISSLELLPSPFQELNRAFGGGIVPGSVILIGGEPGIGKSTLMMQICGYLSQLGKTYYVSGEESTRQLKMRAKRLGVDTSSFLVSNDPVADMILATASDPLCIVFDSLQTLQVSWLDTPPGSVTQVREAVSKITEFSKREEVPIFIVAHITKEGLIAGPKLVEHMVDVVMYFEGSRNTDLRILRTLKNRFGPSGEMVIFEMTEYGLKEVANPEKVFIESHRTSAGVSYSMIMEGSKPLCVEIQCLVSKMQFNYPRRISIGLDPTHLSMLSALLSKKLSVPVESRDIYLKISGGFRVTDPGVDLAVIAAILGSFYEIVIPHDIIFIGEIGLDGSVKRVGGMEKRIKIAEKAGFTRICVPPGAGGNSDKTIEIDDIHELAHVIRMRGRGEDVQGDNT